ncbi:MAG: thioredoxin family protein [Acidobacteria bacterium]|nr:thioredoxin family protein [Acidobacteriota bacterium]
MRKNFVGSILFLLCIGMATATDVPVLEGEMTAAEIREMLPEYAAAYRDYEPDAKYIGRLSFPDDLEIFVVFGSWCSDSLHHVPAFMKILEAVSFTPERTIFIAVNRQKDDSDGLSAPFNIERVPTFIFLQSGREIGRIVENPEKSLEEDMLVILQGK